MCNVYFHFHFYPFPLFRIQYLYTAKVIFGMPETNASSAKCYDVDITAVLGVINKISLK